MSVFPAPEVHRKIIRYAVCFGDELWVGTQNGVYVINEKQNSVQHIPADAGGKYGLGDAIVDKIYRDREGGTWICTQFGGASYLPVRSLDFSVYLPGAPGTVCGRRISELAEGKDGTVWISTQDGGVCYWNPKAQTFVKVPESPDRQNVLSLFASDDLVGAGYFKGGIDLIIPGTASSASSSISSSTFSSLTSSSTTVSPVSVASSAISTTNIFFEGRFIHSIPHNSASVKVRCLPFIVTVGESSGWAMVGTSSVRPTKGGLLRRWNNSVMLICVTSSKINPAIYGSQHG